MVHLLGLSWSELATELSQTWEWREGRLLAYELIFQFLIKNHWLYTFGTSSTSKTCSMNGEEKRLDLQPVTALCILDNHSCY